MSFDLVKVCADCPFRKDDKRIDLAPGRREQIIKDLLLGESPSFSCHKTVYELGSTQRRKDSKRSVCAGAAAVCEKFGRKMQILQIAERMGAINSDHFQKALEETIDPEDLDINRKDVHL